MRFKYKSWIIFSFIFVPLLLVIEVVSAESGTEKLDSFYFEEFNKFNMAFEKHAQQVEKCLKEMERFEKGEIFLDPQDCPKLNEMRLDAVSLLEEVQVVINSYESWLKIEFNDNATKQSFPAFEIIYAQITIYSTKYKKAVIQTKRVRKNEEEIANSIEELSDLMERLNTVEQNED